MTDQELADKIVALGVGESMGDAGGMAYILPCQVAELATMNAQIDTASARYFVRDWRVAGALMEKAKCGRWCLLSNEGWYASANDFPVEGDSLPRAINEACVEALSD